MIRAALPTVRKVLLLYLLAKRFNYTKHKHTWESKINVINHLLLSKADNALGRERQESKLLLWTIMKETI